jgi:hypothetical protein
MAPGDPVPPATIIYRAVSPSRVDKATARPKETAFLLRPASDKYPAEDSLSFGVSPNAAVEGLDRVKTCHIQVADILALGLKVCEDDDPEHVQVSGMPLYGVDDGLALAIAKAIRDKASVCS